MKKNSPTSAAAGLSLFLSPPPLACPDKLGLAYRFDGGKSFMERHRKKGTVTLLKSTTGRTTPKNAQSATKKSGTSVPL